ncbi:ExbD/TolR family protein [Sapientia aquatica]|uniref:Biopolymer transporter ExbD n=1 Tax=Sapientia aquatica TaxID=1549640 RepID=A0A4R5W3U7_9BURK|nr:biopolymer transporter ExbD [Sapientia aquatica]TDK67380.1 biopolymer transporter ExbD [Sapientia aquatica]
MKIRRLRKDVAHLEITAFINLIVVLVPFLLSTAVFTRLAVIDLTLPPKNSGGFEQIKPDNLQLEIVVRKEALEVGDRIGGLIQRIPATETGPDLKALSELAQQIKTRFPTKTEATVLAEPDTSYDTIVKVMDALRSGHMAQGDKLVRSELFPNISIGDAPIKSR